MAARKHPVVPRHGGLRLDDWTARRLAEWHPQAIATAAGVSLRTVKRWRADIARIEVIQVGAFRATFAIRYLKPPMQLTTWSPA